MGRWEPEAQARLREAAMQLFLERGFEQTTVADIAARAGLTARTFFRYFADKREVLFGGSLGLQAGMVEALVTAPASASAMQAVAAALDAAAEMLGGQPDYAARRQSVVMSTTELQERELIKMAHIAEALAEGLRDRGVADLDATLAAEAAVCVLRVSFERWVAESGPSLATVMAESMARLRSLSV